MRVNYKGCGRDFNFRVAEISFTENELRTMELIEKVMNVKGWDLNIITDGYASCKVDDYEEYTVNFRTHVKSYKNKKRVDNPKEDWLIFENTHEHIITQQEFDLVQELRKNKRRPTKHEEVNPFSGICYCADCGKKLYLCRATTMTVDQEHLKCGTYAKDKNGCTIDPV